MTKDEAKKLGFKQYKDTRYYVNAEGIVVSFANTQADRFASSSSSKILTRQKNGYGVPTLKFKHKGVYAEKLLKHIVWIAFHGYEPRKIINLDGDVKNVNLKNLGDYDAIKRAEAAR